jgi:hypothetical protein
MKALQIERFFTRPSGREVAPVRSRLSQPIAINQSIVYIEQMT